LVAEPSGAVAPAAYLHRFDELTERFGLAPDAPVVAVISGGNLDPALLASLIAEG
jgi:threonine dehydratase